MRLPPDGYAVRPATRDDIETIARLVQTIDRHDEGIVEPSTALSKTTGPTRCSNEKRIDAD